MLAVDLNPLCVNTARNNVQLNRLEDRIEVKEGRAEAYAEVPADLMLANIHWDVLKSLLATEGFRRNPWIILSGLMRSHARDLEADLARSAVRVSLGPTTREDDIERFRTAWITVSGALLDRSRGMAA